MAKFTVFTPTYNRAYTLPRLYKSLKRQTYKDFTWIIVDDGSTDDTDRLIQRYMDEGLISIKYKKVENGGKQRAANIGCAMSSDELFMCVDSDDYLTDYALEILAEYWTCFENDQHIAGMIALHGYAPGCPRGSFFPKDLVLTNAWDLYEMHGFSGDALHIYRRDLFYRFPAPLPEKEKFISEGYVIAQIARHYDIGLVNEVVYISEYLPDGYSIRPRQLARQNPISFTMNKKLSIEMSKKLSTRFINTVLYDVGCMMKGNLCEGICDAPNKGMAILAILPAFILLKTEFNVD